VLIVSRVALREPASWDLHRLNLLTKVQQYIIGVERRLFVAVPLFAIVTQLPTASDSRLPMGTSKVRDNRSDVLLVDQALASHWWYVRQGSPYPSAPDSAGIPPG
jgi:hypothetical protein